MDARLRSFTNWPRGSVQSPETLATAGFYYQNCDDQVLCFQCNGGLRSWQREDDAWFEHARWFPKCEFVQLVKGPQYIAQVQQQARQGLDEAMNGEPVQKALQLGLSEGRIRAVTKYHLERFGSPFKCAETLIDAVLDYQREEEQQQSLDDGDDDEEQSSSAIVREGEYHLLMLEFCASKSLANYLTFFFLAFDFCLFVVGRILDTIFNNNHDSTPTLLSTNGGGGVSSRDISDDFIMPETSSHSSHSTAHTIALPSLLSSTSSASASASAIYSSPSTTEITTSTANQSERQRSNNSISSSQKETTALSIQNNAIATEMHIPETCRTNNTEGTSSNGMCSSGTSTNDNNSSSNSGSNGNGNGDGACSSGSTRNTATAPVSISCQLHIRPMISSISLIILH